MVAAQISEIAGITVIVTADSKFSDLTQAERDALAYHEFERRRRIGSIHRGRTYSEETKQRIAATMREVQRRKREAREAAMAAAT